MQSSRKFGGFVVRWGCPLSELMALGSILQPWQTIWSVSYTHLDVYKRQECGAFASFRVE